MTEKASGKLYWHPEAAPCGKVNPDQRGMNLVQFHGNMGLRDQGAVFIDNLKVTVSEAAPLEIEEQP